MSIKDMFAKPAQIQEMRAQTSLLKEQTETLERQTKLLRGEITSYQHVQEILVKDILSLTESQTRYTGNSYKSYDQAVKAITEKYNSIADWGTLQTGTIIDLRAAFILGEGIQVSHTTETREEAKVELQWVEDFMDYNDLDREMAQEIAKEAEIEGKIAIQLFYDNEKWKDWTGMISARYISWLARKYKIIPDPEDYLWYKNMEWPKGAGYAAGKLEEAQFIYKKFGGRLNDPNEAQPKIMKCLDQIDRLDKALYDLRQINHLFASPTPDWEVNSESEVTDLQARLEETNWKIGKAFIHTGKFQLVTVAAAGVDNLIKEIETCVKMISGATGIPIHYLGLLDLLKNRATGENTRELIMTATSKERQIWIGAYEEMFTKAMEMFNANAYKNKSTAAKLDPTRISVDIPQLNQEHWDHIEKVFAPMAIAGIISKEYAASQIPGIDMEAEAERKKKREEEDAKLAKEQLETLKAEAALNQNDAGEPLGKKGAVPPQLRKGE